MLNTFAEPAAVAPPIRVATTSHQPGKPRSARNIVGTVVTSSNSITRGLVKATYALTFAPRLCCPAGGRVRCAESDLSPGRTAVSPPTLTGSASVCDTTSPSPAAQPTSPGPGWAATLLLMPV